MDGSFITCVPSSMVVKRSCACLVIGGASACCLLLTTALGQKVRATTMINEENILHEYETWSLEGLLKTRGHIEQARERLAWQGRYHEVELAVIERLLAEKQAQEHEDARTGLAKV